MTDTSPADQHRIDQLTAEYKDLLHAMQSGVAAEMDHHTHPTDPKHLRVGVNAAMVDHAALVGLLMSKGIITQVEYVEALRDGMAAEVRRYEDRLSDHFGARIHLS